MTQPTPADDTPKLDLTDAIEQLERLLINADDDPTNDPDLRGLLRFVEDTIMEEMVILNYGNIAKSALCLGVHRLTLSKRIKRIHYHNQQRAKCQDANSQCE